MSLRFVCMRIAVIVIALFLLPMLTSPCLSETINTGQNIVTDVIVGHNNKGPYSLSWTDVPLDSISVVINGRTLRKGDDFNIDSSKGLISFNSVLVNDAIVRVTYQMVPGKSKRNTGNVNIPITLDVFQRQDASIRFTGLYAQDDPKNPNVGKTIVGLGGDRKWAGSNISSTFLLSQRNDGSSNTDLWDRAAMKFGGATSLGALKLIGSYLRSGDDFGGASEYGLGLGKRATDLSALFAPNKYLQMTAKYLDLQDTAGITKGNYSRINEQSMVFTPVSSTRFSLARSVNESGNSINGSNRSTESNLIKLEQGIGAKTNAVASFENATYITGNIEDQVQTRGLQVTSNILQSMSMRALMQQRYSELYGAEQILNFGVTAKPISQVNVDVAYGTLDNDKVGHQSSTNVSVTASPIQLVAVQASYSETDSTKLGQTANTKVTLKANPIKSIELQSSLSANAQNESGQFQRDFTLSSAITQYAKVSALFSQKGVNDWDDATKGAQLELRSFFNTTLSTGYRYIETGPQVMTIQDYAACSKPWSFLSLSGSLRERHIREDIAPSSAAMQVSLAPLNYFTVTGDYQVNPEDKNGVVQNYKSAALGFGTRIGSIGLNTNYTAKKENMSDNLSDERQIGVNVPLFGHGNLDTGIKVARYLNNSEFLTKTYSLGYRHAVGSDFNLSLTGYYTQYLQDKMLLPNQTEYKAEANLGVKF